MCLMNAMKNEFLKIIRLKIIEMINFKMIEDNMIESNKQKNPLNIVNKSNSY